MFFCHTISCLSSAADVKMEIPILVWSLKSSILSSISLQRDKTFGGVVSAAVEQSRRKANVVAQGDGKFGPWGWPQDPSKPKKNILSVSPVRFVSCFCSPCTRRCCSSGWRWRSGRRSCTRGTGRGRSPRTDARAETGRLRGKFGNLEKK